MKEVMFYGLMLPCAQTMDIFYHSTEEMAQVDASIERKLQQNDKHRTKPDENTMNASE